ncbi:hypothetical protein SEA_SWITZERLAND_40 [Gordonia phage Switzerland]|uniref:Uncharacterized protein n=1 Tax=Gordonia phage KatherineG TaxID=1838070 RepID=A0A166YE65_9CAUD|nr:hypothetical protein BEN62_gp070 [Gordonia phage KatherineG]ANA87173.1 hypothetical protein PBI_KATHERINEG_40 [Gordonia phage KatherineG]UOK18093.1 hypothetical protein SEA_SWITZERLAND_40 [Gordonia phage Switzerland]
MNPALYGRHADTGRVGCLRVGRFWPDVVMLRYEGPGVPHKEIGRYHRDLTQPAPGRHRV